MEIEFPIEFIVSGTPVSFQAKRNESKEEWKERVRDACTAVVPRPHFVSDELMAVTLYYLPDEPMQGDVDNIVKLVIDAMCKHIYLDDRQVERIVVQKFEPGNVFSFSQPTQTFAKALSVERPVLYVKVSNDPFEELV